MAGVSLNDKKLAANVRTTALTLIKKYLDDDSEANEKYKKDLLLRMSGSLMPRLNEHSGDEGGPIIVQLSQVIGVKNGITHSSGTDSQGPTQIQSN